jgi:hypothetical protein
MKTDPIIEEIRKAGYKLCESNGNDLHAVCDFLRRQESNHKEKVVSRETRNRIKTNVVSESNSEYKPESEG